MEMENKITPELIAKAKQAKSPEELLALAKENGMEFTEENAKAYFEQLHKSGELSDDELDNVAGGLCRNGDKYVVTALMDCRGWTCEKCDGRWNSLTDFFNNRCSSDGKSHQKYCYTCKYCSYERGLWLCSNPNVHYYF